MTPDPISLRPESLGSDILHIMLERRIGHLPVVQDGKLIGIISIGDVVKYRLRELENEAHMLHDYISGGA